MHFRPTTVDGPADLPIRPRRGVRSALRRLVRRHRRPLAAALASLAALIALTALRAPAPVTSTAAAVADPTDPRPGEVAVPVRLASPALAATLRPGDEVDLVTVGATGPQVAARARVLVLPSAGSGLIGGAGGTLLVAVPEQRALAIAVSPEDGYSLIIRPR